MYQGKNGSTEHSKGNRTVPEKVAKHIQRMDTNRLPRQVLKYGPEGRRNIVQPKKRWRDQLHFED